FLTAWHALVNVAPLKPGERVLIHAAAGGVGQAAIQVARALGAEVLATAHPSKHHVLESQGVAHVFTSRDSAFGAAVLGATGGRGVDVVLNSLSGALIAAGLDCLAPGGRFVEIGKSSIWSHAEVAARRPDVRYAPFDLADVARESPDRIRDMFNEVASRLGDTFEPLRVRAFASSDVVDAFRLLSRARHVGRVVVTMPESASSGDGVQLVTGGFGALGRSLVRDLVTRGARRVAIVSRTVADAEREAWMAALRRDGADVRAYVSALCSRTDAERTIAAIEAGFGHPVRGVFHLAGALADATIAAQTDESLARAIDAKLTSARSLHEATRTRDLHCFVLFSSAAALLGTPGQANYAAANAGLDALATARRAEGLPALSINWGPWASDGMAARLADTDRERMAAAGVAPLDANTAWDTMHALVATGGAQAAVIDADWRKLAERMPDASLLRSVGASRAIAADGPAAASIVAAVAGLDPAERRDAIARYLEARVAAVLGRPEGSDVPHARGFFALGMDSLTSLELRNRLEKELSLPLPPTITLEYGSVELLSGYLATAHPAWTTAADAMQPADAQPFADLSEAELATLLAKELEG
ncbi:MAG: SDR family NAD(P)-dependent oxidoreductase, partial [Vicinamibacterales bacterium]